MTDKELLELAAKAAQIDLCWNDAETPGYYSDWRGLPQWEVWNPLVFDGHALRLAVELSIAITPFSGSRLTRADVLGGLVSISEPHGDDAPAATRRAIVRAAAAIGAAMAPIQPTGEPGSSISLKQQKRQDQ